MKLWTTILVCLSVLALGLAACDKKKVDEEAVKGGGGGGTSVAGVCKSIDSENKACEREVGELKKLLGDKLWDEFASCAIKAGNKKDSARCMTEDMEAKLSALSAGKEEVEPKVEAKEEPSGDKTAALSPKDVCEEHAGDKVEACTRELEQMKEALGDADWKEFTKCIESASGEKALGKCAVDAAKKGNKAPR